MGAVKYKQESYQAMLTCGTHETAKKYWQAERTAVRAVAEVSWPQRGSGKTVWHLRRGKQFYDTVYGAGGKLVIHL